MMIGMTPKEKIAVSLPPHLVRAARKAVRGGRAPNVSAYVADALTEKAKLDDLSALLDEMLAETGGPPTAAERRAAARILRGTDRKKR
jgi:Arc/MetJ-type ribon-helix-helix transcriptional regulator